MTLPIPPETVEYLAIVVGLNTAILSETTVTCNSITKTNYTNRINMSVRNSYSFSLYMYINVNITSVLFAILAEM